MPLRRLTGRDRSRAANAQLAALLAAAAGVVDVSSYLALRQFTSHVTGLTAAIAIDLGHLQPALLARGAAVLLSFVAGAAFCALLVNWSRRRERESLFAFPLFVEALLLAAIGVCATHAQPLPMLCLLAATMGLQNAIITKISDAEIRTTHVTGTITDIGIELGRALYLNRNPAHPPVRADRHRLALLLLLVGAFFLGGLAASLAFPRFGLHTLLPLALLLAIPTLLPIAADLRTA